MKRIISFCTQISSLNKYTIIYSGFSLFTAASITVKMEKQVFNELHIQGHSIPKILIFNAVYTPVIIGYSIIRGTMWPLLFIKS